MVQFRLIKYFTFLFNMTQVTRSSRERKDPYNLRGLEQAIFLLEQLCGGRDRDVIISQMHGDEQLVSLWINFLQHNHWIERSSSEEWRITAKGIAWINRVQKSSSPKLGSGRINKVNPDVNTLAVTQ